MKPKIDFSECEFINSEMKFYTYYDFCDNRKVLKRTYNNLSPNAQRFYMWYVYSNTHMKLNFKNAIWDYLNNYKTEQELLDLKKSYRIK